MARWVKNPRAMQERTEDGHTEVAGKPGESAVVCRNCTPVEMCQTSTASINPRGGAVMRNLILQMGKLSLGNIQ